MQTWSFGFFDGPGFSMYSRRDEEDEEELLELDVPLEYPEVAEEAGPNFPASLSLYLRPLASDPPPTAAAPRPPLPPREPRPLAGLPLVGSVAKVTTGGGGSSVRSITTGLVPVEAVLAPAVATSPPPPPPPPFRAPRPLPRPLVGPPLVE